MADLTKLKEKAEAQMKEHFKANEEESVEEEETQQVEPETEPEESESESVEESIEEEPELQEGSKVAALLKENARLRAKNREIQEVERRLSTIDPTVEEPTVDISPAESRLFTAWRDEALEELTEKYPQYKTDPNLWKRFTREYEDRVSEIVYAKKRNLAITKKLFRDRILSVHSTLGLDSNRMREEGKKDLLKAQSAASIMGAGANRGQVTEETQSKNLRKRILPRVQSGLQSWVTKKQ